MSKVFTKQTLEQTAELAKLPIPEDKLEYYAGQFNETLDAIDTLNKLDTSKVLETSQVTGLTDISREDEIDTKRMFAQEEALSQAKHVSNGFFVVEGVLDEK